MNLINTEIKIGALVFLHAEIFYIGLVFLIVLIVSFYYSSKKKQILANITKKYLKHFYFSRVISYLKIILSFVIYIVFLLLLSDPRYLSINEKVKKDGIDIFLALDVSKSMEATDLKPSRIEAAKTVIRDFVSEIKSDRVGLIVFAGKPYSSTPLSYDYQILEEILSEIDTDILNQNVNGLDGTAIGDAILLAEKVASRSKGDDANREQIIILLTDGDANRGVEPLLAAQSLAQKGVKVYSIGIGSKQGGTISFKSGPFVQQQRVPPLNEKDLREIAKLTNAKFYRAENNESLELIFEEIELLEKTEIETEISKVYSPAYKDFLWILTWLLLLLFGMQILLKD